MAHRDRLRNLTTLPQLRAYLAAHSRGTSAGPEGRGGLYAAVARFGRVFDRDLLRQLVHYEVGDLTLRNPSFGRTEREQLVEVLVEEVERMIQGPTFRASPFGQLGRLGREGWFRAQTEAGRRILDRSDGFNSIMAPHLASLFSQVGDTLEADLARIAGHVRGARLLEIARHPNAGPATWERVLQDDWQREEVLGLSAIPKARQHPEIRSALRYFGRYAEPRVLRNLAAEATAEEFVELFREMSRRDERVAAEALLAAPPEQLTALTREDLLPLLSSPHEESRLQAIRVTGHLRAETSGEDSPRRSGRRPR